MSYARLAAEETSFYLGDEGTAASRFASVPGVQAEAGQELFLEFSGPFHFYREFWKAHNLEHLADLLPVPEVAVKFGDRLDVPLSIHNGGEFSREVTLTVTLPEGWSDKTKYSIYPVRAHEIYPVRAVLVAPQAERPRWEEITWKANVAEKELGSLTMRVYISGEGALPQ